MAIIRVHFFLTRERVARNEELVVHIVNSGCILNVLAALPLSSGERRLLFDVDGALQPGVVILKDGYNVVHLNGLETPVSDGDTVSIIHMLAGG